MFLSIQSIPGPIFAKSDVKVRIQPGVKSRVLPAIVYMHVGLPTVTIDRFSTSVCLHFCFDRSGGPNVWRTKGKQPGMLFIG